MAQKLVGLGYQQVCGDPEVWGDGITPVSAAHLEGKHPPALFSSILTSHKDYRDPEVWCYDHSCASCCILLRA